MSVAVTVDLDWACEAAIAELLDFLRDRQIPVTVFSTHRSRRVEAALGEIEVGLHPHFAIDSSHGSTLDEVVRYVLELPHNVPAFRCHRFAMSNEITERLHDAGLQYSSNVCTDLELVPPFRDRFGLWQFPVFLEDGGYLYRRHPLEFRESRVARALAVPGVHVLVLHPMHFALNTPDFAFMRKLKDGLPRAAWTALSGSSLDASRHSGCGVREFLTALLDHVEQASIPFTTLGRAHAALSAPRTEGVPGRPPW